MARTTRTFTVEVEFDDSVTDAESVASALDILTETALSTPGVTEEYGGIDVGEFFPLAGNVETIKV